MHQQIIIASLNRDKTLENWLKDEITNKFLNMSDYISIKMNPPDFQLLEEKRLSLGVSNAIGFCITHDKKFVVIFENTPAKIYNDNFVLNEILPFDYTIPTNTNNSYYLPTDIVGYSYKELDNTESTIIAIAMPTYHIVRFYKKNNNVWSYLTTIGDVNNNGYTSGLLDTPNSIGMDFDKDINKLVILISNLGNAPNGQNSFVKQVLMNIDGTVSSESVISYPLKNINSSVGGSLAHSETENISRIRLYEKTIILNNKNKTEFGISRLITNNIQIQYMINNKFQDIENNDFIDIPIAFDKNNNRIIIADSRGHVCVTNTKLDNTDQYIGFPLYTDSNLNQKYYYGNIKEIKILEDFVFILNNKELIKINLFDLKKQTFTLDISREVSTNYLQHKLNTFEIEDIVGFYDYEKMKIEVNNKLYDIVDILKIMPLRSTDTIKLHIYVSETDIKKEIKIKKGVLIIKPL